MERGVALAGRSLGSGPQFVALACLLATTSQCGGQTVHDDAGASGTGGVVPTDAGGRPWGAAAGGQLGSSGGAAGQLASSGATAGQLASSGAAGLPSSETGGASRGGAAGASGAGNVQTPFCVELGQMALISDREAMTANGNAVDILLPNLAEGGAGGGGAGASILAASLPELPAGERVVLREQGMERTCPALARSGSVLGMVFGEVCDRWDLPSCPQNGLRFATNPDPSRSVAAWSFADVAFTEGDVAGTAIAGDEQGFDVAWTVRGGLNGARLVTARFAADGQLVQGPWLAAEGGSLTCSLASSDEMVGLACAEQRESSGVAGWIWIKLCDRQGFCRRCTLQEEPSSSMRPDIVWDGSAFAVVFPSRAGDDAELRLARVDRSGEVLLAPTTLAATPTSPELWPYSPAAVMMGDRLAVGYGENPTAALFDLEGGLVDGPWTLDAGAARFRYEALPVGDRLTLLAVPDWATLSGAPQVGGVRLMSLDRSAPESVASLELSPYGSSEGGNAAAIVDDGEMVAVHTVSGDLALSHIDSESLAPKTDPEFVLGPSGRLTPVAIHCNPTTCYLLAYESAPTYGASEKRTGIWLVDRASGRLTAPAADGLVLGVPRATPLVTATGFVTILPPLDAPNDGPGNLVSWDWSGAYTSFPGPTPSEDRIVGTNFLYDEGQGLRLFFFRYDGEARVCHQSFVDGQFGAPQETGATWVDGASVLQCGGAYYYLGSSPDGSTLSVTRWQPGVDTDFVPVFETPFVEVFASGCSDSLMVLEGITESDTYHEASVFSLDGMLLGSLPTTSETSSMRWVEDSGGLLVFPRYFAQSFEGYRLFPEGTIEEFDLTSPPGWWLGETGARFEWPLAASDDTLAFAFGDSDPAEGSYLQVWRLP